MEKRLREYLRHLERLDYDVMSEEELILERDELEMKITEMHHEMIRLLIPMTGLGVCACIFLAAAFIHPFIGSYVASFIMCIGVIVLGVRYKTFRDSIRLMSITIDKLIKRT